MRRSEFPDLLFVGFLAALAMLSAATPSIHPAVRFGLAVLLVCVLPGYSATALLFHRRPVDLAERAVLTLGLSLAFGALGGVVLNLTPRGLTTATWALLLGSSTIVMSTIAFVARLRGDWYPHLRAARGPRSEASSIVPFLLIGVAFAITVGAVTVAQAGVRDQPRDPFTELWLIPGQEAGEVAVGIRSFEGAELRGRLEISAGGVVLAEFPDIDLGNGETWDRIVPLKDPAPTDPIVASLYRDDAPDVVFRLVRLWLT